MVKHHTIKLSIKNNTPFVMTYNSMWFDSGRVANHFEFPKVIQKSENHVIVCHERDWALSGCSGYVQYTVNGNIVTIAFSNPSVGTNKVGVGVKESGKIVWDNIDSHDYQDFQETINCGGAHIAVHCRASEGTTNDASVVFHLPYSQTPQVNYSGPGSLFANNAYPPPPYIYK